MLAKGIIWHQDVFASEVCEHAVRPVKHRGSHKNKAVLAQVYAVTGFYNFEVPVFMIVFGNTLSSFFRNNNRSIGNMLHHCWKSTRVVCLSMVGYNVIYLFDIDYLINVIDQFLRIWSPDCIYKSDLFIDYKICIVC